MLAALEVEVNDMDLFKNTYFVTGLYLIVAILVVVLSLWREHIYREKSDQQQNELNRKQTRIMRKRSEVYGRKTQMGHYMHALDRRTKYGQPRL